MSGCTALGLLLDGICVATTVVCIVINVRTFRRMRALMHEAHEATHHANHVTAQAVAARDALRASLLNLMGEQPSDGPQH